MRWCDGNNEQVGFSIGPKRTLEHPSEDPGERTMMSCLRHVIYEQWQVSDVHHVLPIFVHGGE